MTRKDFAIFLVDKTIGTMLPNDAIKSFFFKSDHIGVCM